MKLAQTSNFVKQYKRLSKTVQKQADKQLELLEKDFYHPSLNTKRFTREVGWWEFRVSRRYRMLGKKIDDTIVFHSIGIHDIGLGKK